jgi:hypothetical protein
MSVARRTGIELLEESVDLLRRAPAGVWAWYFAGAVPFFGATLIFWTAMSGSLAVPDPLWWALPLALLFGWRQYARAWFASGLYGILSGGETPRHRFAALAAVWLAGIARIPLLIVPFPAVIALFRNISVSAARSDNPLGAFRRAGGLAARGGDQISALLTLVLASLVIWINVITGMLFLPALFQILTGEDLLVLRTPGAFLNSAVMVASFILTWTIVDCVLTAFYALRVFYGESEETGADLLGAWRRAIANAAVVSAILVCFIPAGHAQTKPDLRKSIDQVLTEKQYQWREPPAPSKEQNPFVRWTDNLIAKIHGAIEAVKRGIARFIEWLVDLLGSRPQPKSNRAPPALSLSVLSYLVIAVLAGAIVALLLRTQLRGRRLGKSGLPAGPPAIDLEDPALLANQLPENEWIAMARDFMARGDSRMALRAYFLASLAFLASRELLAIGRSKTNLDYLREVRRRARSAAGLEALFAGGIRTFESAWYGMRDVSGVEVEGFAENFERMRAVAGGA